MSPPAWATRCMKHHRHVSLMLCDIGTGRDQLDLGTSNEVRINYMSLILLFSAATMAIGKGNGQTRSHSCVEGVLTGSPLSPEKS